MYIPRDELQRTARAPAKLNLFLEVGERRGDGFHELETLIVPIRIWDSLSLVATHPSNDNHPGEIALCVRNCGSEKPPPNRDAIPAGSDNLVCRALQLLRQRSGCRFGAEVELVKRIPLAAGLGGGSSDAAAALRLANRAWRLNWPLSRLAALAAELGSDVPYFLSGGPAICRGRGERIERLPGLRPLNFVVVKPRIGLNTADVYRAHDVLARGSPAAARKNLAGAAMALRQGRWGDLPRWMHNRLQAAAAALTPWVHEVSSAFEQLGFVAHQLTGSGSAYFGVCRHAQQARRVAAIIRTKQLGLVYATRSCQ